MSAPIVKAGEVITCPRCGFEIAEAARDLFKGERMLSAMFKGRGNEMGIYERMNCRACQTPYYDWDHGKIHLQGRGWVP